jgi:hypothetical protein
MTVVDFKTKSSQSGGAGPEDPMLEERVERLEQKFEKIEQMLSDLQFNTRESAKDTKEIKKEINDILIKQAVVEVTCARKDDLFVLHKDVAEIKGKISNLPIIGLLIAFGILKDLPSFFSFFQSFIPR